MTTAQVTLKSLAINGNVAVCLQGVEITYKWSNFTKIPDVPSKFAATDAQVEVDFNGWTNPTIIVRGIMDANDSSTNAITLALLKLFAKEKVNPIYIYEQHLFPTANTSMVQVVSFDVSKRKNDDKNEGRLDFTINLVETI